MRRGPGRTCPSCHRIAHRGLDKTRNSISSATQRSAEGAGDRADADVAIVDEPAIGAVRITAAGEIGHGRHLSRSKAVAATRRHP